MKPSNPPIGTPEDRTSHELAWLRHSRAEDELLREVASKLARKRVRRLVAGSCALFVASLAGLIGLRSSRTMPEAALLAPAVATTATVSRPPLQTLPDGSTIELKDDAQVSVDYSAALRRVTLVSGEAHFQVTKNSDRPFIVQAGRVEVRAVGTAFAVQLAAQTIEIVVTEGSVCVSPEAASGSSPVPGESPPASPEAALVSAGRRCVVESDLVPRVQEISDADVDERLAWRIPHLEFSRTPLAEVLALMNQQASATHGTALEIADPGLNQIKLTGFLRADNVEGLVRLLETNFGVNAERSDLRIVLRKSK